MSVNKLEALLDALASLKGWHNPDSECYQLRNPLGLASFARVGKHEMDHQGRRIFQSSLAGMKACLFDLEVKVSGKSRAGLKEDDAIANLLRVYELTEKAGQQQIIRFLRRALKDQTVDLNTKLTYFREDSPENGQA